MSRACLMRRSYRVAGLLPSGWTVAVRLAAAGGFIVAAVVVLAVWLVVRQVESAMLERAQETLESSLKLERELLRAKRVARRCGWRTTGSSPRMATSSTTT